MGKQTARRPIPAAVWLTTLVATLSIAGLAAVRHWQPRIMARHWQNSLAEAADDEALALLRQMAAAGDDGVALLTASLDDPRPAVAQAARQVLWEELARWKLLGVQASSGKLTLLAQALAERVESFGPRGRAAAAELAVRLLQSPTDQATVNRGDMFACCEYILRTTAAELRKQPTDASGQTDAALAAEASTMPRSVASSNIGDPLSAVAALPGGGLPMDARPAPALPYGSTADRALVDDRAPRRRTDWPDGRPLAQAAEAPSPAGRRAADEASGLASSNAAGNHANRLRDPNSSPGETPAPPLDRPAGVERMETLALFELLHSEQGVIVASAEQELSGRGFSNRELDLARRISDPDPRERRRWTELLPRLPGVDAAPWLVWLSGDSDANVRLTALTIMATSGDPALIERVSRLAAQDSDPRIRDLLRLVERPAGRSRR